MVSRYFAVARWAAPVNARLVGWARIGVGAAAVIRAVDGTPVLLGLSDPHLLRVPYLSWLQPSTSISLTLILLWVAAATAFTLGYRTRIAGALLTGVLMLVLVYDRQTYSNHLYLMMLLVGLLTVADSGAALSVDARHGRGAAVCSGGAVLLIKAQVSIVYGFAGLWKLNEAFLSGLVLASQLGTGLVGFPDRFRTPYLLALVSAGAVCTEIAIAVGLWFRRSRTAAIGLGVALHGVIALFMAPTVQLIVFAMELVVLYPLFIGGHERTVVWDDSCSFCTTWVKWFRRLDVFGVIETVRSSDVGALQLLGVTRLEADTAMQLIDAGQRSSGFEAVRRILGVLPLAYLVAPFLGVPGVRRLGGWWYRRTAQRRHCSYEAATG